jgi:hypothetical protein
LAHIDIKATLVTLSISLVLLLLMLQKLPVVREIIPQPTMALLDELTGMMGATLAVAGFSVIVGIWAGYSYRTWMLKRERHRSV